MRGYQLSARDVTEQKHLREMLVKATGNIELLMERYEDKDKKLFLRLETILNNALRIAEIVKRVEGIKKEKTADYLKGVKMTDLKEG